MYACMLYLGGGARVDNTTWLVQLCQDLLMEVLCIIDPPIAGGVTSIDSIVTAATAGQNFGQLFSALTMLIFGALTVDCIEFQPLTVDYVHVYRRMCSNSTLSVVYN